MPWIQQPKGSYEDPDIWWNNQTKQYAGGQFGAAPSAVDQFAGKFATNAPAGYYDSTNIDNYIKSLSGKGVSIEDMNAALSAGIKRSGWDTLDDYGNSRGESYALGNLSGIADSERVKWLGQSFDGLGKDTGWNSFYNADAAAKQQSAVSARNDQLHSQYDASTDFAKNDLGTILAGFGAVAGAGALGGAFGGGALGEGALASQAAAEGSSGLLAADGVGATAAGDVIASGVGGGSGAPASSGFKLPSVVGENGIFSSTGNSIADAAINSGVRSAVTSGIQGGDPLKSGLTGAITGGALSGLPSFDNGLIDSTIKGGAGGGLGAILNGGNVGTGILTGAAGGALNNVGNTALNSTWNAATNAWDSVTGGGTTNTDAVGSTGTDTGDTGGTGGGSDTGGTTGTALDTAIGTTDGSNTMYDEYGNYLGDITEYTGNYGDAGTTDANNPYGTDLGLPPGTNPDGSVDTSGAGDWNFMNEITNADSTTGPSGVSLKSLWKWLTTGGGADGKGRSPLSYLGAGAGGALDYKASSDRTAALKAISDRTWGAGQQYRDNASRAMTPGFDLNSIPGYSGALSTGMDAFSRSLSAKNGNPWGQGGAAGEATAWAGKNIGLPAWQNYFNSNSNAGGLSSLGTQSIGAAINAADASAGGWGSLGQTARNIFDPQPNYQKQYLDILGKQYGILP